MVAEIPVGAVGGKRVAFTAFKKLILAGLKFETVFHRNFSATSNSILKLTACGRSTIGPDWKGGDTKGIKGNSQSDLGNLHFVKFEGSNKSS